MYKTIVTIISVNSFLFSIVVEVLTRGVYKITTY